MSISTTISTTLKTPPPAPVPTYPFTTSAPQTPPRGHTAQSAIIPTKFARLPRLCPQPPETSFSPILHHILSPSIDPNTPLPTANLKCSDITPYNDSYHLTILNTRHDDFSQHQHAPQKRSRTLSPLETPSTPQRTPLPSPISPSIFYTSPLDAFTTPLLPSSAAYYHTLASNTPCLPALHVPHQTLRSLATLIPLYHSHPINISLHPPILSQHSLNPSMSQILPELRTSSPYPTAILPFFATLTSPDEIATQSALHPLSSAVSQHYQDIKNFTNPFTPQPDHLEHPTPGRLSIKAFDPITIAELVLDCLQLNCAVDLACILKQFSNSSQLTLRPLLLSSIGHQMDENTLVCLSDSSITTNTKIKSHTRFPSTNEKWDTHPSTDYFASKTHSQQQHDIILTIHSLIANLIELLEATPVAVVTTTNSSELITPVVTQIFAKSERNYHINNINDIILVLLSPLLYAYSLYLLSNGIISPIYDTQALIAQNSEKSTDNTNQENSSNCEKIAKMSSFAYDIDLTPLLFSNCLTRVRLDPISPDSPHFHISFASVTTLHPPHPQLSSLFTQQLLLMAGRAISSSVLHCTLIFMQYYTQSWAIIQSNYFMSLLYHNNINNHDNITLYAISALFFQNSSILTTNNPEFPLSNIFHLYPQFCSLLDRFDTETRLPRLIPLVKMAPLISASEQLRHGNTGSHPFPPRGCVFCLGQNQPPTNESLVGLEGPILKQYPLSSVHTCLSPCSCFDSHLRGNIVNCQWCRSLSTFLLPEQTDLESQTIQDAQVKQKCELFEKTKTTEVFCNLEIPQNLHNFHSRQALNQLLISASFQNMMDYEFLENLMRFPIVGSLSTHPIEDNSQLCTPIKAPTYVATGVEGLCTPIPTLRQQPPIVPLPKRQFVMKDPLSQQPLPPPPLMLPILHEKTHQGANFTPFDQNVRFDVSGVHNSELIMGNDQFDLENDVLDDKKLMFDEKMQQFIVFEAPPLDVNTPFISGPYIHPHVAPPTIPTRQLPLTHSAMQPFYSLIKPIQLVKRSPVPQHINTVLTLKNNKGSTITIPQHISNRSSHNSSCPLSHIPVPTSRHFALLLAQLSDHHDRSLTSQSKSSELVLEHLSLSPVKKNVEMDHKKGESAEKVEKSNPPPVHITHAPRKLHGAPKLVLKHLLPQYQQQLAEFERNEQTMTKKNSEIIDTNDENREKCDGRRGLKMPYYHYSQVKPYTPPHSQKSQQSQHPLPPPHVPPSFINMSVTRSSMDSFNNGSLVSPSDIVSSGISAILDDLPPIMTATTPNDEKNIIRQKPLDCPMLMSDFDEISNQNLNTQNIDKTHPQNAQNTLVYGRTVNIADFLHNQRKLRQNTCFTAYFELPVYEYPSETIEDEIETEKNHENDSKNMETIDEDSQNLPKLGEFTDLEPQTREIYHFHIPLLPSTNSNQISLQNHNNDSDHENTSNLYPFHNQVIPMPAPIEFQSLITTALDNEKNAFLDPFGQKKSAPTPKANITLTTQQLLESHQNAGFYDNTAEKGRKFDIITPGDVLYSINTIVYDKFITQRPSPDVKLTDFRSFLDDRDEDMTGYPSKIVKRPRPNENVLNPMNKAKTTEKLSENTTFFTVKNAMQALSRSLDCSPPPSPSPDPQKGIQKSRYLRSILHTSPSPVDSTISECKEILFTLLLSHLPPNPPNLIHFRKFIDSINHDFIVSNLLPPERLSFPQLSVTPFPTKMTPKLTQNRLTMKNPAQLTGGDPFANLMVRSEPSSPVLTSQDIDQLYDENHRNPLLQLRTSTDLLLLVQTPHYSEKIANILQTVPCGINLSQDPAAVFNPMDTDNINHILACYTHHNTAELSEIHKIPTFDLTQSNNSINNQHFPQVSSQRRAKYIPISERVLLKNDMNETNNSPNNNPDIPINTITINTGNNNELTSDSCVDLTLKPVVFPSHNIATAIPHTPLPPKLIIKSQPQPVSKKASPPPLPSTPKTTTKSQSSHTSTKKPLPTPHNSSKTAQQQSQPKSLQKTQSIPSKLSTTQDSLKQKQRQKLKTDVKKAIISSSSDSSSDSSDDNSDSSSGSSSSDRSSSESSSSGSSSSSDTSSSSSSSSSETTSSSSSESDSEEDSSLFKIPPSLHDLMYNGDEFEEGGEQLTQNEQFFDESYSSLYFRGGHLLDENVEYAEVMPSYYNTTNLINYTPKQLAYLALKYLVTPLFIKTISASGSTSTSRPQLFDFTTTHNVDNNRFVNIDMLIPPDPPQQPHPSEYDAFYAKRAELEAKKNSRGAKSLLSTNKRPRGWNNNSNNGMGMYDEDDDEMLSNAVRTPTKAIKETKDSGFSGSVADCQGDITPAQKQSRGPTKAQLKKIAFAEFWATRHPLPLDIVSVLHTEALETGIALARPSRRDDHLRVMVTIQSLETRHDVDPAESIYYQFTQDHIHNWFEMLEKDVKAIKPVTLAEFQSLRKRHRNMFSYRHLCAILAQNKAGRPVNPKITTTVDENGQLEEDDGGYFTEMDKIEPILTEQQAKYNEMFTKTISNQQGSSHNIATNIPQEMIKNTHLLGCTGNNQNLADFSPMHLDDSPIAVVTTSSEQLISSQSSSSSPTKHCTENKIYANAIFKPTIESDENEGLGDILVGKVFYDVIQLGLDSLHKKRKRQKD